MLVTKYIITLNLIIFLPIHTNAQTFRIPAEWENQETVWLTWFGEERRDSTSCRIIEALPVIVIISSVTKSY
jgi:agmatine/peptidylarginine deiminase